MTAAQLAAEMEVSVRTVYRDIEALHASGVPLYGGAVFPRRRHIATGAGLGSISVDL
jgi:predicted DNA-binding transcriptional regulator YafY